MTRKKSTDQWNKIFGLSGKSLLWINRNKLSTKVNDKSLNELETFNLTYNKSRTIAIYISMYLFLHCFVENESEIELNENPWEGGFRQYTIVSEYVYCPCANKYQPESLCTPLNNGSLYFVKFSSLNDLC